MIPAKAAFDRFVQKTGINNHVAFYIYDATMPATLVDLQVVDPMITRADYYRAVCELEDQLLIRQIGRGYVRAR